jgi:hypothetical protein
MLFASVVVAFVSVRYGVGLGDGDGDADGGQSTLTVTLFESGNVSDEKMLQEPSPLAGDVKHEFWGGNGGNETVYCVDRSI